MSKMTKPTVVVVRFHESDVIVASGEILNITGLGNGKEAGSSAGDGIWAFNSTNGYRSDDIYSTPSHFVELMNDYLHTNYSSPSDFKVGESNVGTLVSNDMNDLPDSPSSDASYNGTWRWNGRSFVQ